MSIVNALRWATEHNLDRVTRIRVRPETWEEIEIDFHSQNIVDPLLAMSSPTIGLFCGVPVVVDKDLIVSWELEYQEGKHGKD